MSHRVRSLIPFLCYADMTSILPTEKLFTTKTVQALGGTTISPKLAKKLGPSNYGLLLEEIIECLLVNNCNIESLNHVSEKLDIELWSPIAVWLEQEFILKNIHTQPQVEIEDLTHNISGHPDLVSIDTVYDIKTTGRFGHMRIETIFQLLSYYCLFKQNNINISNIGLVLPLQLKVITYNLTKWEWRPFYKALIGCVDKKIKKENHVYSLNLSSQYTFLTLFNEYVGSHCPKDELLNMIPYGRPLQFFISGNTTANVNYNISFLNNLKIANDKSTAPTFIHSPYVLNLSHPNNKDIHNVKDKKIKKILGPLSWGGWTFYCLKQLLEFGYDSYCKGIIVHVGRTTGKDYDESVLNMWYSVIACSLWATPECPLLIETPAGQKGEILTSPEELGTFYLTLPEETKKVVGICVDTGHVFMCGHDPVEYLMVLEKMNIPIHLIHYNDSKGERGCCKDRHACIGKGYVGFKTLMDILLFAVKRNIPMLTE